WVGAWWPERADPHFPAVLSEPRPENAELKQINPSITSVSTYCGYGHCQVKFLRNLKPSGADPVAACPAGDPFLCCGVPVVLSIVECEELMSRVRAGDPDAAAELVQQYEADIRLE